ncbi:dipeptidase PepE [Shewanella dokdonensis]|uniref:Peptidase E n=1 Tax=Shewanella dokdonensis TaxID=712036 RepID=A0ABX8DFU7_9GAMM|nr:dipeptidase PepE [Shewanella dokdonensis]MCL1075116.1 dipeptidase PepE [Shewanella dokdonensis]QVK23521.1 dipeptidase PepE [Shewanella dokdonensis]
MAINALLLSSSRAGNTSYLAHALPLIEPLTATARKWIFIPYAGVSMTYDSYLAAVVDGLAPLKLDISSIHQHGDPKQAIRDADGILVGGGNTFHLLHELYRYDLLHLIREQTAAGKPYIGWSAGSNIAGQSIRTTNDMPIIEPPSFTALGLLPFQINPHYSKLTLPGHNGESRAQRILEFTCVDPLTPVLGIQEGTALRLEANTLTLLGDKEAYLFSGVEQEIPVAPGSDLSHMLQAMS